MGADLPESRGAAEGTGREQFARRFRGPRSASGLSLRELERKVHVSDSSLSRYFAGVALPPNPLVHQNAASGPAGRFDYVTDRYVRTKTQPGEFRITLRDSPSGWLCVKLVDARTHQVLGRPE